MSAVLRSCPQAYGNSPVSSPMYGVEDGFASQPSGPPTPSNDVYLCDKCRLPITDEMLTKVRQSTWHASCTVCSVCSCGLDEFCFVHEGQLLCERDYHRLYAVKCATCQQPMLSQELCMRTGPRVVHHFSCFVCSVCRRPIATGEPYTRDTTTGALICKDDYHSRQRQTTGSSSSSGGGGGCAEAVSGRREQHQSHPTIPRSSFENGEFTGGGSVGGGGGSVGAAGKRGRTTLSQEQRIQLQKVFEENPRPLRKVRETLAREFGLPVRVVQVWFQNQRAREKKLASCGPDNCYPPPPASSSSEIHNNNPHEQTPQQSTFQPRDIIDFGEDDDDVDVDSHQPEKFDSAPRRDHFSSWNSSDDQWR